MEGNPLKVLLLMEESLICIENVKYSCALVLTCKSNCFISAAQIREMQMNIVKYSRHFLYSHPAQPLGSEDLTWRIVRYLYLKLFSCQSVIFHSMFHILLVTSSSKCRMLITFFECYGGKHSSFMFLETEA